MLQLLTALYTDKPVSIADAARPITSANLAPFARTNLPSENSCVLIVVKEFTHTFVGDINSSHLGFRQEEGR